ncbi:MAG TPA: GDSL-type esterase/lipase family protein [Phycisphaerae bacterium]|jgi:lysophospholipase L1-like esterase
MMLIGKLLLPFTVIACALAAATLFAQQQPAGQGADAALAPPAGALPIKSGDGRGGLAYAPASTSPAPGGVQANAYWSLAIQSDPADLKVYREANAKLGPPKAGEDRVIFLGDSITENWGPKGNMSRYFPDKPNYIGRGYTSETTLQMLVRFRPDVLNLQPKVVVIMAGVNDIAGNTGAVPDETIHDNFISMFDLAKANDVKVVLISTLPATRFFWQPGLKPSERIVTLNTWLKDYAGKHGIYYVDAHSAMKDANNGMPTTLSSDTVHPNPAGYTMLSKMTEEFIEKALKGEPPAP